MAKVPIMIEFIKSNNTIVLFLSNQSPKTPAMGDNNNLGKIDIESIAANITAEPVIFKTYRERANCCILLPNRDTNFPTINNVKSFCFKSFIFSPPLFDNHIIYRGMSNVNI